MGTCRCILDGTPCDACRADVNRDAFVEFMKAWAQRNARTRRLSADQISDGVINALNASSQCNDGSY